MPNRITDTGRNIAWVELSDGTQLSVRGDRAHKAAKRIVARYGDGAAVNVTLSEAEAKELLAAAQVAFEGLSNDLDTGRIDTLESALGILQDALA